MMRIPTLSITLGEIFGLSVSLLSLYFTHWIYRKQKNEALLHQDQLETLNSIASETHMITSKMESDGYRRKFANAFFHGGKTAGATRFICVFPAKIKGRRLPSISASDYHVLHVLQSLLGADNLDLSFQSVHAEGAGDDRQRDTIYLCGPQSNPVLREYAPALEVSRSRFGTRPTFDGIPLRCWFANDEIEPATASAERRIQKKIWIEGRSDCLPSQAEQFYEDDTKNPVAATDELAKIHLATDYAILLRLTTTRKIFVLAGIHQFGTWIAGEFLRRLALESDRSITPHERAAFLQTGDVMAIVWGEFDRDALVVRNLGVHQKCLWVLSNGEWKDWDRLDEQNGEEGPSSDF